MTPSRRVFLTGLSASLIAAPAIVRAAALMPARGIIQSTEDSYDLLWQRYAECARITKENLVNNLYGGRLVWADGSTINFTEVLPEKIYKHLELATPVALFPKDRR